MWVTLQSFNRPICVFSKLRDQHGKLVTNAHQVYRYQAGKLNVVIFTYETTALQSLLFQIFGDINGQLNPQKIS